MGLFSRFFQGFQWKKPDHSERQSRDSKRLRTYHRSSSSTSTGSASTGSASTGSASTVVTRCCSNRRPHTPPPLPKNLNWIPPPPPSAGQRLAALPSPPPPPITPLPGSINEYLIPFNINALPSICFNAISKFHYLPEQFRNPRKIEAVWVPVWRASVVYIPASTAVVLGSPTFGAVSCWHYTVAVLFFVIHERANIKADEEDEGREAVLQKVEAICHKAILEARCKELEDENCPLFTTTDNKRLLNAKTYKAVLWIGMEVKAIRNQQIVAQGTLWFEGWGRFRLGRKPQSFAEKDVLSGFCALEPVEVVMG